MHGARRIEVAVPGLRRDDDAPALRLDDVVAQRPGDGVERQRSVGEPLDELEAGHRLLLVGADGPITPAVAAVGHRFISPKIEDEGMLRIAAVGWRFSGARRPAYGT